MLFQGGGEPGPSVVLQDSKDVFRQMGRPAQNLPVFPGMFFTLTSPHPPFKGQKPEGQAAQSGHFLNPPGYYT